ncbi:MAG: hypothetical protein H0T42_32560 [Deltaproteobacteria bacterium]|nr:hypothetical protein [Deltaproteobacteria bacterium]
MSTTLSAAQQLSVLQGFVDQYADDLGTVRAACADPSTPEPAQRVLIGALNYALDMLDMFPDHYKGLGVADDAIVLRLAAKLAVEVGAAHAGLVTLAAQATKVASVFDNLAAPLERLVAKLPEREVRGRTAAKILSHKDTRIMFDADVGREAKRHVAQPIDTSAEGPERALIELRKMVEHALKKAEITY